MTDIFKGLESLQTGDDVVTEEQKKNAATGKVLFVVVHAQAVAIFWSAGAYMREHLGDNGAGDDSPWSFEYVGLDWNDRSGDDGVFVGDLVFVDDGPGDYPGTREVAVEVHNVEPIKRADWGDFCSGNSPWDLVEGWT